MSFSSSIFYHMNADWYEYICHFRFQFFGPSFLSVDRCSRRLPKKETGFNFTSPETLCLQWYENLLINYWLTCFGNWTIWTLNFIHRFCALVSEKTTPFSFSCKLMVIKVTVVKKFGYLMCKGRIYHIWIFSSVHALCDILSSVWFCYSKQFVERMTKCNLSLCATQR